MTNRKEPQPHLFGAFPYQYRTGASVASAEQPPPLSPELVHDHAYPYTLREYRRDVSRWQGATNTVQCQGPLVALAIGGAARVIVDQIDDQARRDGVVADFQDGRGNVDHSGVELVFRALEQHFPPDEEAQMLRAGLDFFGCTPRASELTESFFLRYGSTLDRANRDAELGISFPFRSWIDVSVAPPATPKGLERVSPRYEPSFSAQSNRVRANSLRRGRRRSIASVRRYEKGGRVTKQLRRLSARLRAHAVLCGNQIASIVGWGHSLPKPP